MSICRFFEGACGPIIYYQGTFDPIHKGHRAALEAAIAKMDATGAVVVVGDEPNPDKPNRLLVDVRREMACRMFADAPNILVSPLSQRETKQALLKSHRVIALIGSDACPLYANRASSSFYKFCVNLRYLEEGPCPATLAGKAVVCVVPSVRGVSSSQIKECLQSHPEVYKTAQIKPGTPVDQLDSSVLDFILKNKLYLRDQKEIAHSLKDTIERYVSERVFQSSPCICACLTPDSLTGEKEGGRSGDLTFSVVSEEKKLFVKAFVRSSHITDCEAEYEGIKLACDLSLSWAHALKPIDIWHCSSDSFIVVPYLELPDMAKVSKNAQNSKSRDELIHMCFCVGRALSELHYQRLHPAQEKIIEGEARILNERTFARLKKLPAHMELEIRNLFSISYKAYLKNPGMHTYVHGDANPSNFIVDEKGKVTLLDLGGLALKRTKDKEPLGCPAEDYYRFLEGIYWFNFYLDREGVLPLSVIDESQKAFKKGYATFPSTITEEAHHYFSTYWKIKNSKFNPEFLNKI